MGYTTDFSGRFELNKELGSKIAKFLQLFNETRRMGRNVDEAFGIDGEFYVFGGGSYGQGHEPNIRNYNGEPETQPGLWCQWCPSDDLMAIEWDNGEKFYCYTDWLVYLIHKVLAPNGYVLNGEVIWQGEETGDVGKIYVRDNRVFTKEWDGVEEEHLPTDKMRTDIVLILEEDGLELSPNIILGLPAPEEPNPLELTVKLTATGTPLELAEHLKSLATSIAEGTYDEGGTDENLILFAEIHVK